MSAEVLRELARAKVAFQLRAIETVIRGSASADTRPQGGDAKQAPFTSGAVAEGQTPNLSGSGDQPA